MTAVRVGVLLPGIWPLIALLTAVALLAAIGTSAPPLTVHMPPPGDVKNLRPQLATMSVAVITCVTAAVVCDHFEFAPQLPVQVPSAESFIEPDLSRISRMSGGNFATACGTSAQFMPLMLA